MHPITPGENLVTIVPRLDLRRITDPTLSEQRLQELDQNQDKH